MAANRKPGAQPLGSGLFHERHVLRGCPSQSSFVINGTPVDEAELEKIQQRKGTWMFPSKQAFRSAGLVQEEGDVAEYRRRMELASEAHLILSLGRTWRSGQLQSAPTVHLGAASTGATQEKRGSGKRASQHRQPKRSPSSKSTRPSRIQQKAQQMGEQRTILRLARDSRVPVAEDARRSALLSQYARTVYPSTTSIQALSLKLG